MFELDGILIVGIPVALDLAHTAQSRPLAGDLHAADLVSSEQVFLGSHVARSRCGWRRRTSTPSSTRAGSPSAPSRLARCSASRRTGCARSRSAASSTTSASSRFPTRSSRSRGRSTPPSTRSSSATPKSGAKLLDELGGFPALGAPPGPRPPRAPRWLRVPARAERREPRPRYPDPDRLRCLRRADHPAGVPPRLDTRSRRSASARRVRHRLRRSLRLRARAAARARVAGREQARATAGLRRPCAGARPGERLAVSPSGLRSRAGAEIKLPELEPSAPVERLRRRRPRSGAEPGGQPSPPPR